jgi:hypothetical protein
VASLPAVVSTGRFRANPEHGRDMRTNRRLQMSGNETHQVPPDQF